ncbi:MAG: penicillin-binding protein 2 [Cyanobacteria bacterium SIG31]|nr:penicillin-binding protein 2 [Cyanobacteria bacterium SIG31]
MRQEGRPNKNKIFSERLMWLQIVFAALIAIFVLYLFANQVLDIRHFRTKAKNQRRAYSFVMRGNIYDRNGIKLATDTVYYDIFARKADFVHTPEELAKLLAPILKISQINLTEKLKQDTPLISLKKNVDRKTRDAIAKLNLREIPMDKKSIRTYPQGSLAAHVLGYYNFDADVASGVEYTAKDKLESVSKGADLEITPKGKVIYNISTDPIAATKPIKGKDITLTIDAAVQHVCEKALMKAIQKFKAFRGAVIVMNPRNGEILAYAVYPYFDPNNFKTATSFQTKNWTLTDVYPPGSTFKAITVASAMELEKINRYTKINDTGKIKVGWWPIKNYDYNKNPNPGWIDLVYLFEHSSNVGSVLVAQKMSKFEFHSMLKKFGFGEKTGIDLPGESIGILKAATRWDSSDHASMGYGYGSSVTAIQMASAVAAIANDGVRVTPHVIKYSPEEEAIKVKKVQVMTPEHARIVTDLLTTAVNNSKSIIKSDSYNIAAKTGTSIKPKENGAGYTNKLYTSIVGYLPASDPQVLIYIIVDSAQGAEIWGNTVAAPIFKEISTQVTHILNLQPDKIK